MASFKPIVEEIYKNLEGVYDVPPKPGAAALTGWNDNLLDRLATSIKLPSSLKAAAVIKANFLRFYNYYFNGILPPEASPHQVIFPMIALLKQEFSPESDTSFFPPQMFDREGFFQILTSEVTPLPDTPTQSIAGYTLEFLRDPSQIEEMKTKYLATPENNLEFYTNVRQSIDSYNPISPTTADFVFSQLSAFLGLLLFRGCVKDEAQLARGMNKKLIKTHINNLVGWPLSKGYNAPCQTCINGATTDLDKGNIHSSRMLILILKCWKDSKESQFAQKGVIPRLQAALLTHTAANGLGLVNLMLISVDHLSINIKTLLEHTLTENSAASWQQLTKFASTYLLRDKPEKSYLWARIVNDGYFSEFASRLHPYLAGIFAGIIDSYQIYGSIKQAAWFQQKKILAESGYLWGKAVVRKMSQIKDNPLTSAAQEVAKFLEPTTDKEDLIQELLEEIDPLAAIEHEDNEM